MYCLEQGKETFQKNQESFETEHEQVSDTKAPKAIACYKNNL